MVEVLKAYVVAGKPSGWGARFEAALKQAEETQTLRWSLAMDFVVPRKGPAEVTTRLLGLTVHMLAPPAHADLTLALKTAVVTPEADALAMSLTQTAGSALIRGIETWPASKAEAVLTALGKWGVADAAGPLLGGELEAKMPSVLLARVGRPVVVAALRKMTATNMPHALVDQLGSEVDERAKLAYDVVSRGGPAALAAVAEKLTQRGYPPTVATTAAALKADPALLERLTWQLQGLLMTPLAWQFEAEASRLLTLEGDCLAQFEAAQKSVHPKILLKQPLYARCQALRAYHLMGTGSQDDAETLIRKAVAEAGGDDKVRRRYVAIMAARARAHLDAGDIEKTEAIIAEIDPHHKDPQILGLLADISTTRGRVALQSGDQEAAQRHFIEAKRLDPSKPTAKSLLVDPTTGMRSFLITILVILLVVGFTSVGLRYLGRVRTQGSFQMLMEEPPQSFSGPGGRRLLVGGHALLTQRRLVYRLVPWMEVRDAFVVGGDGGHSGLLLWLGSGDAYLIPANAVRQFDAFVELATRYLTESGVPVHLGRPEEDWVAQENDATVHRMLNRDRQHSIARMVGLALGVMVAVGLAFIDVGAGVSAPLRTLLGLGIGGGIVLTTVVIADTLFPVPRA